MKYNNYEYEEMILALNVNKNKKTIGGSFFIAFIITFVISHFIDKDFYFNLILGFIAGFVIKNFVKKSIYENAKKVNFVNDIISIEQTVYEDKIMEKVFRKGDIEMSGEYYYKDVVMVKEDKENFYIYLNNNSAIIVNKSKLENVKWFKKVLADNKLVK